jgi:hypothetical protein
MKAQTFHVKRIGDALVPAGNEATAAIRRLPQHTEIPIRVWRERSHEQNAMYWRALARVVEATGKWHTAEELHLALKVACGYVERVRLIDGRLVLVPGSIAFDRMNQEEAQLFYDAALRIVCDELMGGIEVEELLAA